MVHRGPRASGPSEDAPARTLVGVATIRIEVDDDVAARLAERASATGVSAEELARRAVAESVREPPRVGDLAFFGVGANDELQAERADELLAEGFGA